MYSIKHFRVTFNPPKLLYLQIYIFHWHGRIKDSMDSERGLFIVVHIEDGLQKIKNAQLTVLQKEQ